MAKLMRCHTPHWQGNTFVDAGKVFPEGSPGVIPIYFEEFSSDEPPEPSNPPEEPKLPEAPKQSAKSKPTKS